MSFSYFVKESLEEGSHYPDLKELCNQIGYRWLDSVCIRYVLEGENLFNLMHQALFVLGYRGDDIRSITNDIIGDIKVLFCNYIEG